MLVAIGTPESIVGHPNHVKLVTYSINITCTYMCYWGFSYPHSWGCVQVLKQLLTAWGQLPRMRSLVARPSKGITCMEPMLEPNIGYIVVISCYTQHRRGIFQTQLIGFQPFPVSVCFSSSKDPLLSLTFVFLLLGYPLIISHSYGRPPF